MQESVILTGIVLKAAPVGEYDRRVVLLTLERGKVTAFARGARRQGSRLMAATNPFSFGTFRVYEGRTAYNLAEAQITTFFESLREDFEKAYVGMYFLEVCDYCAQENNDERQMLRLLYQSLRALTAPGLTKELVRYIFELKLIVINGEFPGVPKDMELSETAGYTIGYIADSSIEKLYTFTVKPEVLRELKKVAGRYRSRYLGGHFNSLTLVESMEELPGEEPGKVPEGGL